MANLPRYIVYPLLLVTLGVGVRLMYYGIETVVGSSPNYSWPDVVVMLAGVALFLSGIIISVLTLPSHAYTHH